MIESPQHYLKDGIWYHHFRQSDIARFRECPEKHRRHILGLAKEWQNDSAVLGTAFHLFVSEVLEHGNVSHAWHVGMDLLCKLWEQPGLQNVQIFGGLDDAKYLYGHICKVWCDNVLPDIPIEVMAVEKQFDVLLYTTRSSTTGLQRDVFLMGTSDLWLPAMKVWDWKTSTHGYSGRNGWEHERYGIQPTVYLAARHLVEHGYLPTDNDDSLGEFTYKVIHREPQGPKNNKRFLDSLSVERTMQDVYFLQSELESMAELIEADLPAWPLRPTDWHCSNKWCESWSQCRGLWLGKDPWKLMEKVQDKISRYQG